MPKGNVSRLFIVTLVAQFCFVAYFIVYLISFGYLPAPFHYDSMDSFMDFFNTNFWVDRNARFEEWASVYPIAVFAFGKLFRSASCDSEEWAFQLRACDSTALIYMFVIYFFAMTVCAYRLIRARTDGPISIIQIISLALMLSLSTPGLYALERGNYIILAFLFLALSGLTKKNWISAIWLSLAINIKQYLIFLLLVPLLKRRFAYVSLNVTLIALINLIGLIMVNEKHYSLLIDNMINFSGIGPTVYFDKLWNSTSIVSWVRATDSFRAEEFLTSNQLELMRQLGFALVALLRFMVIVLFLLVAKHSCRLSEDFTSFALLAGSMVFTDSFGGYAVILLFPFMGAVLKRKFSKIYSILLLLLLIPMEFSVGPEISRGAGSYLGIMLNNIPNQVVTQVSLGAMVRPVIMILLVGVMTFDLARIDRPSRPYATDEKGWGL